MQSRIVELYNKIEGSFHPHIYNAEDRTITFYTPFRDNRGEHIKVVADVRVDDSVELRNPTWSGMCFVDDALNPCRITSEDVTNLIRMHMGKNAELFEECREYVATAKEMYQDIKDDAFSVVVNPNDRFEDTVSLAKGWHAGWDGLNSRDNTTVYQYAHDTAPLNYCTLVKTPFSVYFTGLHGEDMKERNYLPVYIAGAQTTGPAPRLVHEPVIIVAGDVGKSGKVKLASIHNTSCVDRCCCLLEGYPDQGKFVRVPFDVLNCCLSLYRREHPSLTIEAIQTEQRYMDAVRKTEKVCITEFLPPTADTPATLQISTPYHTHRVDDSIGYLVLHVTRSDDYHLKAVPKLACEVDGKVVLQDLDNHDCEAMGWQLRIMAEYTDTHSWSLTDNLQAYQYEMDTQGQDAHAADDDER